MKFFLSKNKILTVVILILIVFSLNFFQKEVKNIFYIISAPIQKIFWSAGDGISDFFTAIFKAKILKIENEILKLKNQQLLAEIATKKELEKENEILRKALNLDLQKEFKLAFAEIISKDIWQDFLKINKGVEDGISKNMLVITEEKILVGTINEVYKNFSSVKLVSHHESSFEVKIIDREIIGITKGKGKGKVILDLIPQDKEIQEGDLVATPSLNNNESGRFLVGLISKIEKSDIEPFQKAEISPFFDIDKTQRLFVILNY